MAGRRGVDRKPPTRGCVGFILYAYTEETETEWAYPLEYDGCTHKLHRTADDAVMAYYAALDELQDLGVTEEDILAWPVGFDEVGNLSWPSAVKFHRGSRGKQPLPSVDVPETTTENQEAESE